MGGETPLHLAHTHTQLQRCSVAPKPCDRKFVWITLRCAKFQAFCEASTYPVLEGLAYPVKYNDESLLCILLGKSHAVSDSPQIRETWVWAGWEDFRIHEA